MDFTNLFYVIAAVLFILGIKRLSSPKTARTGNALASIGMLIAILATVSSPGVGIDIDFKLIAIGMIVGSILENQNLEKNSFFYNLYLGELAAYP